MGAGFETNDAELVKQSGGKLVIQFYFGRDEQPKGFYSPLGARLEYSGMTRQSCNSFSYDPYIIKDSSYPEGFSIFSKSLPFPG